MKTDKKEALRYLGYQGNEPDAQTWKLLEEAAEELERASLPKSIYREYDCKVSETENTVTIGELVISSKNLARNLRGCERVIILAATIGRGADMMIKKYSVTNLAKATVVQAAGASCIENYVDEVEEGIRKEALTRGLYLRPRFSPGYGDFALEHQKDIFAMLECSKRIGITLTEGNLMMPSKSVTALIGLTREQSSIAAAQAAMEQSEKCRQCENTECEFRS